MKRHWLVLLFLVMAGTISAQQPPISYGTSVNPSLLHQWLHSGDPRLIAWASDFARKTHDKEIIAEMPALLEHWKMPLPYGGDVSQVEQRRAVIAVLDTLIQENVQVPIPAIKAIAPYFPDQAIILISRLPLSESRLTLNDWTYGREGSGSGRTLARVASMILAKDFASLRTPAFDLVARVVTASEENLQISIRSSGSGQLIGHGGMCRDSFPRETTPGWPQIYTYTLIENDPRVVAPVVLDLDGDRIVSWRREMNEGWGTCYSVQWFNPVTRHRLIAYWLGVHDKDMPWQPVEGVSIIWKNKVAYERKLGTVIETQREKLHATVETLFQRGFLTDYEAAAIQPKMVVTIKCDIEPCPLTPTTRAGKAGLSAKP